MTRAHLTPVFPQIERLAEQRRALYVDVSVLTESGERKVSDTSEGGFPGRLLTFFLLFVASFYSKGSEMVRTEMRNIPIVTSPYSISFKNTPSYYKPRITFDVVVSNSSGWSMEFFSLFHPFSTI